MGFSNDYEVLVLAHLLRNEDIGNLGDAAGLVASATEGDVWLALHTASPGEAGTQATNEASYGGYSRISIQRRYTRWNVVGTALSNVDLVQWPTCTSGSSLVTHFSIGVENGSTGWGNVMICYGQLPSVLSVSTGVQPQFAPGSLVITLD